ncbi:MAG: HNH endonuclease [Prevotella sp.]|nr:HNH endonuclease [Prevotella sp.]
MSNSFSEFESDFFHYMTGEGGLAVKTSHDYISRLRFLAQFYSLDEGINIQIIDNIMRKEDEERLNRKEYTSKKAMSDFHAGLVKFMAFIESGYSSKKYQQLEAELAKVRNDSSISVTERTAIIQARVGQGLFRSRLIEYWHGCSVSACTFLPILMASHIKPWKDCRNEERLDVYNGLLLLPNFDRLFDKGYISFKDNGTVICSPLLKAEDKAVLNLTPSLQLNHLTRKHQLYLSYHRDMVFIG